MSIRSQDLDTNALLLYSLGKTTNSNQGAAPVYSLTQDDEDSDGGQGSALRDGEEEGTALKLSLQGDAKEKVSNESVETDVKKTNGTSAAPIDPTLLPAGYGAAIIAAFLAMIQYLNEMAQQGYQVTVYSANAMIGSDNKPGLIQSWVDAGMKGAEAQGNQMSEEAIGSLVSGIASGVSLIGTFGGFVRNSTDGLGLFQNERAPISAKLADAESYKEMLNRPSQAERIAQDPVERAPLPEAAAQNANSAVAVENNLAQVRQEGAVERRVEMDDEAQKLKKAMTKNAQKDYKSSKNRTISEDDQKNNAKIEKAAQHLVDADEKAKAIKKADKWIEDLQSQRQQCESKQQGWTNVMSQGAQMGQAGGQAWGGWKKSQEATTAAKQKATGDVLQQTSSTTEGVKEKATQQAQADREQMSQTASTMAQALAAAAGSKA